MKHPTSLFGQMLSVIRRDRRARLVRRHCSDYGSKGFDSWTQMVSMLFRQLA